ncbi:MAG TPA: hypothetical protein VF600_07920 [Abditibacteriaceae bacterium]
MKQRNNRLVALLAPAVFAPMNAPAWAQNMVNAPAGNAPAASNPTTQPEVARPGNARRQERREQRRQQLQNMTPGERQQLMRQNREAATRRLLERAEVTDAATQNTIVEYIAGEQEAREKSRQSLRTANQKLAQAVRTGAVTQAQLGTLLGEFQNAAADEKERRATTAAELDRKVGYSKNPRLEAVLTILGAIGDESLYLAGGTGGGFGGPRGAAGPRAGARAGRGNAGAGQRGAQPPPAAP